MSDSTLVARPDDTRVPVDERRAAIARSKPFADQSLALHHWLAHRVTAEAYEAGAGILRPDDGDAACFIVTSGSVDLLAMRSDGTTYRLAQLQAGDVFGVEELLTGAPRKSTTRARTPVSVLRISALDFLDLLGRFPECAPYFFLLVRQRVRPARVTTVVAFPAPDGQPGVILKDERERRYLRLSEPGYDLWTLMDGERTVRDLSLAYFARYQRLGVDVVLQTINDLRTAGFVDAPDVRPEIAQLVSPQGRRARLIQRFAAVSKHIIALPDPDRALDAMYRFGVRFLYALPVQLVIALVALAGIGVFAFELTSGGTTSAGASALGAFLGLEVQVILHELAHSLTTKHFGREVHRVGIGWYYFLPIAFVDTSDIWLESRWRRAAVAAAGPYLNLVLSGFASCLALVLPHSMTSLLLAFAATGYLLALANLNPLYEFDGYYVFSDVLNMPNLRGNALAYLGARLRRVPLPRVGQRRKHIYLAYGCAAVAYAIFAAGALLFGYHRLVEHVVAGVLPQRVAVALGWLIAAAMTTLLLISLWQGLHRQVGQTRQST